MLIKKIVEAVMECIQAEMPKFINTLVGQLNPSVAVQKYFKMVYTEQIAYAQDYLDDNCNTDLSKLKCLLRYLMPREYYGEIDKLHERKDSETVYIINGGNNLIAPNARLAKQQVEEKSEHKDSKEEEISF